MEEKNEAKQPETPAKKPAINNDLRTFVIALLAAVIVLTCYHLTRMVIRSRRIRGQSKFVSCQCKRFPKGPRGRRKPRPQNAAPKKAVTPSDAARNCLRQKFADGNAAANQMLAKEKKIIKDLRAQQKEFKLGFKDEKIDGDLATLEFVIVDKEHNKLYRSTIYSRKINGEWKVVSKEDYEAAKKAR